MMKKEIRPLRGGILIYHTERGDTRVDVFFDGDNVWMTQKALAELYQVKVPTVNYHIRNILAERELDETTVREYLTVQKEGDIKKERVTKHYSFQMILAIGYRVRSNIGIHFRSWASAVLSEYARKGFALNDERLKNPKDFGDDYFDELLSRIRDIRSSEKLFYRKVLDIYATSIDYDPGAEASKLFFATVQNKMHYSAHGKTAAEVVFERSDADKEHMGLTNWPGRTPSRSDAQFAKNYLSETELDTLNRIVSLYLEFAELQALNRQPMYMKHWIDKLDEFLRLSGRDVLTHAGKVSAEVAHLKAASEYDKYKQKLLNAQSPVETHFFQSIQDAEKQLVKIKETKDKKR